MLKDKRKAVIIISAVMLLICVCAMLIRPAAGIKTERSAEKAAILTGNDGSGSTLKQGDTVNINTADKKALMLLPGIGEALSERILEYRSENGAFASPEDIMGVSGIGEKTYEKLRDYITTEDDDG